MNDSRFLKIVIIILLLLNGGTMAFIWTHKPPPPAFPPREQERDGGGGPYQFLVNALGLDSNQQKQYTKLRDEHHHATENIQEKNRDLHERLYNLLSHSKDTAIAQQLADSIAANQKQIELITFHHFQKVRAICTPNQQKKFDEVINEAMRMMSPQQQPPPPRPDDGPRARAHIGPPPPQDGNQPPPPPNN